MNFKVVIRQVSSRYEHINASVVKDLERPEVTHAIFSNIAEVEHVKVSVELPSLVSDGLEHFLAQGYLVGLLIGDIVLVAHGLLALC